MEDIDVLTFLHTRENYNTYLQFVNRRVLSKEMLLVLDAMGEYFKQNTEDCITFDPSFRGWFKHIYTTGMDSNAVLILDSMLDTLERKLSVAAGSVYVPEDLIKHFSRLEMLTNLGELALRGLESSKPVDVSKIQNILDKYTKIENSKNPLEEYFVDIDILKHPPKTSSTIELEWRLEELNISCGPLRLGDFIEVGARPDVGKTSFLASEVTHLIKQLPKDRPALWINNEEAGERVVHRIYSAALDTPWRDLQRDLTKARDDYQREVGGLDRLKLMDKASIHFREVESACKRINPGLIVIDQLDKIQGFDGSRDDLRLQQIYQWARELAKTYGPVIALSQADASAENIKWIGMHQLYGSKTMKQGEADAIITVGRELEDTVPISRFKRYIHIPKNKLEGGPRSKESERNGYWEVNLNLETGRYYGLY